MIPFPFESPREFRVRKARTEAREAAWANLDAAHARVAICRRDMRNAYRDLPASPGFGSGPDEHDSFLIERFELARNLLRDAHHARGALRRSMGLLS